MVIYFSVAASTAARRILQRKCPGCHYHQVVSSKELKSPVKCNRCGAIIPPQRRK